MDDRPTAAATRRGAWVAVAIGLALVATSCTRGDGGSPSGSAGPTTTSQPAKVSDWIHEDPEAVRNKAIAALPNACDLVPRARVAELLGGEPDGAAGSEDDGRSCVWRPIAADEGPGVDGADAVLVLQVLVGDPDRSMDDVWSDAELAATAPADVDGCDDAFWVDGLLNARKGDFYLNGTAGLADPSPETMATSKALMAEACARVETTEPPSP